MERSSCKRNHLDSNVDFPPQKRLLTGLEKYSTNSYANFECCENDVIEARVNNLMSSHLGKHNLSLEDAVEASRTAATSALKLAIKARAVAVEKEIIAAKAVVAAKRALELVASLSEYEEKKERFVKKKYRMKKHLPVQTSYNKKRPKVDSKMDEEEFGRNPHRDLKSSTPN